MMIAYFLGKYEEQKPDFKWSEVIEGAIFSVLETSVLTDLKWNVKEHLKRSPTRRKKLNEYVLQRLEPLLLKLDESFLIRFKGYLNGNRSNKIGRRVLLAAGEHAREWEFRLLENANPEGYEIQKIRGSMDKEKSLHDLYGCRQLHKYPKYRNFVDICGELRYQGRWSHTHIAPRIDVLGHSMYVATMSYLFSIEVGACERQRVNNFFLGLFHDLAETQTRDVRGPLKKDVPVIDDTLDELTREMMEREIVKLLPPSWQDEFRGWAVTETGKNFVILEGRKTEVTNDEILSKYNTNNYNPVCGYLVKIADNLSAFIESSQAIKNGCESPELQAARYSISKNYERKLLGKFDVGLLFRELSS